MHKKNLVKILVLLLFFIPCLGPVVNSDGGAFIRSSFESWALLPQEKQMGVINYENGYEKLILVINVKDSKLQGDQAVWIFPVPSNPDDVTIDVLNKVPNLDGSNIKYSARAKLETSYLYNYFSQPYLIPVALLFLYIGGMTGGAYSDGYDVYDHIEKMGLTTEKVTADNSTAFQNYLSSNNLTLTDDANSIIDEYIGEDYCFIVSWISNITEFKSNALLDVYYYWDHSDPTYFLGVSINFPTDKIYYPLKLTKIYKEETIPILIQVLDFVTPEVYSDLNQGGYVDTSYNVDDYFTAHINLTSFFTEQLRTTNYQYDYDNYFEIRDIKFTEINIFTQANFFTEDLWMEDKPPSDAIVHSFIYDNSLIVYVFIFALLSIISSILSSLIVYRKNKPSLVKFAVLGLFNFATLITFYIVSFLLNINQKFLAMSIEQETIVKGKKSYNFENIKWPVIALISSAFVLLFMSFFNSQNMSYIAYSFISFLLIMGIFILPILIFIVILIFGYKKDKYITKFAIIFTILFVLLTIFSQIVIGIFLYY